MNNVLITGASRGIGKAISNIFSNNNFRILCPTRNELDLNNRKSVSDFIFKYKDNYFDVIVNCAGINIINTLDKLDYEDIDSTLQINLISPLIIIKAFVQQMKNNHYGKIVNIGSIWSVVSKSGRTTYSMSKHGLDGITKTLALELAPYNILINTVCPGFTNTEMTIQNNSPKEIIKIENLIPLRRMASPNEIAEIVYFLCSKKNSYITGQKIIVDGGFTIT